MLIVIAEAALVKKPTQMVQSIDVVEVIVKKIITMAVSWAD